MNAETKTCQNCKKNFTIEPEDFDFYARMKVPPPTFCPECRFHRRMSWRNEHTFFRRKDDATGKEMLSGFPPGMPFPVYNRDYWWSDAWDPMRYGRDYDFSKPFFEQFRDLMHIVPWSGRSVINLVNSEYCDQAGYLKNCYLCFNCDYLEDSTYVLRGNTSKDSLDALHIQDSELIYDSTLITKGFRNFFSLDCENSTDMWFSKQCVGCSNCFGCANLRNKNYYIWNKPYRKEEYFEKLKKFQLESYKSIKALKERALQFWNTFPSKYYRGNRNVNSSGDMLDGTKNVYKSYYVSEGQDMRYCQYLYLGSTDSSDHSVWGNRSSWIYECLTCGDEISDLKFCFDCWPGCRGLEYCIGCHSSSDLFGCVGLKKKQYCILNKQYTREDYKKLREKIIEEMNQTPYTDKQGKVYRYGEFFPPELSPFAYNETMLQDAFPLTREEALARGFAWRVPGLKEYETTMSAEDLPDMLGATENSVLDQIIRCISCRRAYRIIASELEFYRRVKVPLPRQCPNCRHAERFKFLNPPQFFHRTCACGGHADSKGIYKNTSSHFHQDKKCPNEFETSYAPDRPEIVYCEQCYQVEVA